MSTAGALSFLLPDLGVVIRARSDVSGKVVVRPRIDTVLVEPGARRFELVARASFPQGRGKDILREIRIDVER
jgi:hypothetical protein